jgi:carbonic anhydrase
MPNLKNLFDSNRAWAGRISQQRPDFFRKLSQQQRPEYLWIGCSDSRVPANEIVGLLPGELFVHRNVANLVVHTDLNCLSVIQFAVDILKVRHVIVCGHYGCSGIQATLRGDRLGLSDNWLRHVQDVRQKHQKRLDALVEASRPTVAPPKGVEGQTPAIRDTVKIERICEHLCELNVIEQALNVCQTTIVREAWERGQEVTVHSWIYGIQDGLLRDLKFTVDNSREIVEKYEVALAALT